jgi:ferric-dicitrate binding protein FerR (iron transport regulator)
VSIADTEVKVREWRAAAQAAIDEGRVRVVLQITQSYHPRGMRISLHDREPTGDLLCVAIEGRKYIVRAEYDAAAVVAWCNGWLSWRGVQ